MDPKPDAVYEKFEEDLKAIKDYHWGKICEKFPLYKTDNYIYIIKHNNIKMRTEEEIRSRLYSSLMVSNISIDLRKVFDIEKELKDIKDKNNFNKEERKRVMDLVKAEFEKSRDQVYYKDADILYSLNAFANKKFWEDEVKL